MDKEFCELYSKLSVMLALSAMLDRRGIDAEQYYIEAAVYAKRFDIELANQYKQKAKECRESLQAEAQLKKGVYEYV